MKYITHSQGIWYRQQAWMINSQKNGCYLSILHRTIDQIAAMLSHHNKVFIYCFELRHSRHQPIASQTNTEISHYLKTIKHTLCAEYQLSRIGHLWVREQERAKHEHYHLAIMLDGNKINTGKRLHLLLQQKADSQGYSLNVPDNPSYLIRRNHPEQNDKMQAAIWRLSYYAKARGKGYRPRQTKDYSTSRIPDKNKG